MHPVILQSLALRVCLISSIISSLETTSLAGYFYCTVYFIVLCGLVVSALHATLHKTILCGPRVQQFSGWLSKNRDENPRMRKIFNSKSSPKVRACADSHRNFWTTNLKTAVKVCGFLLCGVHTAVWLLEMGGVICILLQT